MFLITFGVMCRNSVKLCSKMTASCLDVSRNAWAETWPWLAEGPKIISLQFFEPNFRVTFLEKKFNFSSQNFS